MLYKSYSLYITVAAITPNRSLISQYTQSNNKMNIAPRNEYEHGAFLVDTENKAEKDNVEGLGKFSTLVNKSILLSNVSNDNLMRFYQNDAVLITHMLSMATRATTLIPLFEVLYYGWQGELNLTRAKGGGERKLQAAIGTGYKPNEKLPGYGSDTDAYDHEEEKQDLLSKLLRGKKQQGP